MCKGFQKVSYFCSLVNNWMASQLLYYNRHSKPYTERFFFERGPHLLWFRGKFGFYVQFYGTMLFSIKPVKNKSLTGPGSNTKSSWKINLFMSVILGTLKLRYSEAGNNSDCQYYQTIEILQLVKSFATIFFWLKWRELKFSSLHCFPCSRKYLPQFCNLILILNNIREIHSVN